MKKAYLISTVLFLTVVFSLVKAEAQVTLNLKFFIQGYYTTNGMMRPVLLNEFVPGATSTETDTIIAELHNSTSPYALVASYKGILQTNGTIACTFGAGILGNSYYLSIRHRNTLQTCSANPVLMSSVTNYDFTTSASMAYGSSMIQMQTNVWAFYNGDINQDQNIDLIDFPPLDFDINNGVYGYYPADINGDGNIDLFDFIILYNNINSGIYSQCP